MTCLNWVAIFPWQAVAPNSIWKMTFHTPDPKVMLLTDAQRAGYGAMITQTRLVIRSPYNMAETYSVEVIITGLSNFVGCHFPVIIMTYWLEHAMWLMHYFLTRWLEFLWRSSVCPLTTRLAIWLWIQRLPVLLVHMLSKGHLWLFYKSSTFLIVSCPTGQVV